MNKIQDYKNYLFIFAHPDDEVYVCGLMHKLVKDGKSVRALFITNGDAGVNSQSRVSELRDSMNSIGIIEEDTLQMGIPEKAVLTTLSDTLRELQEIIADIKPDCVVGMDFEGGHEVHDGASFLTAESLPGTDMAYYVFPVYHMEDGRRVAASFMAENQATDTVGLDDETIAVKIKVLEAHKGQIGHFLHLQRQSPEYFQRLFGREVYHEVTQPIDYTQRPSKEIGYEAHRNGFKFSDFHQAVQKAQSLA